MTYFDGLEDVFIASDNPNVQGRTEFKGDEDGVLIVGNPGGIVVWSVDGAYYGGSLKVSWADVLKHAPAEALLEEQERRELEYAQGLFTNKPEPAT